jgi:hypothetical protein
LPPARTPGTINVSGRLDDESRQGALNVMCSDFTSAATLQIRTLYEVTGTRQKPRELMVFEQPVHGRADRFEWRPRSS